MMKCDCAERIGIEINSYKFFIELKEFFEEQAQKGIFEDVPVEEPYYIGYSEGSDPLYWYADKWYRCNACGTLWEFTYPNFTAAGEVRKFEDGIYPGPETNL